MIWSLIWKEMREQAWRFAVVLLFFFLLAIPVFLIIATIGTVIFLLPFAIWFFPVWMAASTVVPDRASRAEAFLSALPLERWKIWTVKTVAALLVQFALSFPLALACLMLQRFRWPDLLIYVAGAAHLYLMITAITMRARRETTVVMAGVLIILMLFLHALFMFLTTLTFHNVAFPQWNWWLTAPNPLVSLFPQSDSSIHTTHLHLVMAVCWWLLGLYRYNRLSLSSHRASNQSLPTRLIPLKPRRSILTALAWRECHQQGGIVLVGAIVGVLLAAIFGLVGFQGVPVTIELFALGFSEVLFILGVLIPGIVAVILGIASWSSDVHPGVSEFWRSRPIAFESLFVVKLLASVMGLGALLTTFLGISWLIALWVPEVHFGQNTFVRSGNVSWDLIAKEFCILLLILAGSSFLTVLIRRTLYAAIIATVLTVVGTLTLISVPPMYQEAGLVALPVIACVLLIGARITVGKNWRPIGGAA